MTRKIICIKLKTAEDLIAYIKEYPGQEGAKSVVMEGLTKVPTDPLGETPWSLPKGEIILEKARVISLQSVGQGRVAMVLIPWALGDHDVVVKLDLQDNAVCVYPPTMTLEDEYVKQTTTLTLATAMTSDVVGRIKGH